MRKLALFALVLLLMSLAPVQAGPGGCTNEGSLAPMGDEVITVSSTALGFTEAVFAPAGQEPAALAVCTVETDSIRHRESGLNPTAAVGTLVTAAAGAPATFTACGTLTLRRLRMIRVTTDASVTCQYYRKGDN